MSEFRTEHSRLGCGEAGRLAWRYFPEGNLECFLERVLLRTITQARRLLSPQPRRLCSVPRPDLDLKTRFSSVPHA